MIDIVLVNWNSGLQISEALTSISENHGGLVAHVIVVDNNSIDGSMERIDKNAKDFSLKFIFNEKNMGFGAACNQGAAFCKSKYILFLNPDARLFFDSLRIPFEFMEDPSKSDFGIAGIQLIDSGGNVSRTCARFPNVPLLVWHAIGIDRLPHLKSLGYHLGDWDHANDREVDHVIGAFFFIRRSLFEKINGFDERFFVYLEDLDVSYRAKIAGWRSMYLTAAQAFHVGGGTSEQIKATRLFYALRSRMLYAFKHFTILGAWSLVVVTLLVEPIVRSMFSLVRGGKAGLTNTVRGYKMLWRDLPAILRMSRK